MTNVVRKDDGAHRRLASIAPAHEKDLTAQARQWGEKWWQRAWGATTVQGNGGGATFFHWLCILHAHPSLRGLPSPSGRRSGYEALAAALLVASPPDGPFGEHPTG